MELIEILYILGFLLFIIIRKYFTAKFKPEKEMEKDSDVLDKSLLGLTGIAMLLPLVMIWVDFLPFANYREVAGLKWPGLAIFYFGIYMLYRSHHDLGKNWNPEVAINQKQQVIQLGIYKRIRHPMYTAHVLWAIGNALIFSNWVIGPALLVVMFFFLPQRIKREEKLLLDQFGDQYKEYMDKTNSLFPKL